MYDLVFLFYKNQIIYMLVVIIGVHHFTKFAL